MRLAASLGIIACVFLDFIKKPLWPLATGTEIFSTTAKLWKFFEESTAYCQALAKEFLIEIVCDPPFR